jgi:VanZ family protein
MLGAYSSISSPSPGDAVEELLRTLLDIRNLPSSTPVKQIFKPWFPSAIWLTVIALESTSLGSAQNTGRILYPIFHLLFGADPVRFAVLHHALRKTGHFVGYFTLSVLLFHSWSRTFPRPGRRWSIQWTCLAFLGTVLVASLDEWHQSFLPSRTALISDVALDSTAGLVAQIVVLLFC